MQTEMKMFHFQVALLSPKVKVARNFQRGVKKKPFMTYRIFFTNSTSRLSLKQKDNEYT